jgi:membrane protein
VASVPKDVAAGSKIYVAKVSPLAYFWSLLRDAAKGMYEDGCFGIAKGAAYSSLLAFFPIVTTVAALLVQANAQAVARTVARLIYDVIPPGTEEIVRNLFVVRGNQPVYLLVVAVALAAWAGSGVMMSLMEGFRAVYRIPSGRSFVHERAVAMGLVFIAAIPLLGASGLIVIGNRARVALIEWLGLAGRDGSASVWVRLLGELVTFLIAAAAVVLVTALVYYLGPNRKQSFRQVLGGALLSTALWLLSTLAFGWYVNSISNYNVLYGSMGAGIALLVWSYLLSVIGLFGCEFNAVRERRHNLESRAERIA